jgi:hypothetical protein
MSSSIDSKTSDLSELPLGDPPQLLTPTVLSTPSLSTETSVSLPPPTRLQPPTPTRFDLGNRNNEMSEKKKTSTTQSPLATIAQRTQKQRRAAAKLHKKVSQNILKHKESMHVSTMKDGNNNNNNNNNYNNTPVIGSIDLNKSGASPVLDESNGGDFTAGPLPEHTDVNISNDRGRLESVTGDGARDKQGFLSELLNGGVNKRKRSIDNARHRRHHSKSLCANLTQQCCVLISSSSAAWHDEIYGKMTNSAWSVQIILCFIITLLVIFDSLKILNNPNGLMHALRRKDNPTNETADKAYLFFIPCGISFILHLVGFIIIRNINEKEKKLLEEWKIQHPEKKFKEEHMLNDDGDDHEKEKETFQTAIRLKKIILGIFYVLIGLIICILEISTGWYGFMDSAIWVLVGWVGTMSPFGIRGSFSIGGIIMFLYTLTLLIGIQASVLSASTTQKLWQLVVLLYIPNLMVGIFIESQIAQSARLTQMEAEGLEKLQKKKLAGEIILRRVLPVPIIEMVKQMSQVKDAAIAHRYESCTITFIKFVGIHYL